jgi:hypothetical protein
LSTRTNEQKVSLIMSESRPFTAATNKLAYAQAFAGSDARRRDGQRRLTLGLSALRRFHRS